jgi:RHS repeat-associated protein
MAKTAEEQPLAAPTLEASATQVHPARTVRCLGTVGNAACEREPRKPSHANGETVTAAVVGPLGDSIEVTRAQPGPYYFRAGGNPWTTCQLIIPYRGSIYTPCGRVNLYDAARNSTQKSPNINIERDWEYDACGNKVGSGVSYNWGTSEGYAPSGWYPAPGELVATSTAAACYGYWKIVYEFEENFSDGERLADSFTGYFLVTPEKISPESTWGGGNPGELPCSQACNGDPVNSATGDFSESVTDIAIPGRGPALAMSRTYSSLASYSWANSSLGRGWSTPYEASLVEDPERGEVLIRNGNGSQTVFYRKEGGTYAPPSRVLASLTKNSDGTYAYTVRKRAIYTFSSSGRLQSVADLNGNKVTLAYDANGKLQTATDEAGRSLTFAYNGEGLLGTATDSTGRSVHYEYDSAGRLAHVIDVRGGKTSYTYDESGLMLTHEDARSHVVLENTYDQRGRVLSQTDALKHTTTYAYSEEGSRTTTEITNPRGYVTECDYNYGVLEKRIEAKGTEASATWLYEHDPATLGITAVTDPNGRTTKATYDADGNQTSTEDALGHKTTSVYDTLGDLTKYTDKNGVTTTYTYDSRGNLLSESTPVVGSSPAEVRTVTYTHGSKTFPGDITSVTDPNGKTTSLTYDSAGDVLSATDAAGNKATFTYDSLGRPLTRVSPRGNAKGATAAEYKMSYTYDAAGNVLSVTDPLGHKRSWTYDPVGNAETETDFNGRQTKFGYDSTNRRTEVIRADGRVERTSYTPDGRVAARTNGLENATSYSYDPLDHLLSATDALQRTTAYAYDAVGNLKQITDPEGRTTTYSYDLANRLTEKQFSSGGMTAIKFEYDANGRRVGMIDGSGSSSFKYDSLGRLKSATNGQGETVSYGYDLAGNVTKITYPNGSAVTRSFDNAERLATVTDWLGKSTSFAYDPDSNLTSITYPSTTSEVDTYTFNRADQATAVSFGKSKTVLASLTYTRDNQGQLLSESPVGLPGSAQSFTYDVVNRLTQGGGKTYAYDKADGVTTLAGTAGYTYDAAGQLQNGGGSSFSYDALGERTASTPSTGPATSYGFDQAGNLKTVARAVEGATPAIADTYAYDGSGLRVTQTIGGTTRHLAWDLSATNPLLLTDGATSYVYGPYGTPIEQIAGSTPTFLHHDGAGSTRALTDGSGNVVATYSYTPFGTVAGKTGSAATPFLYDGQYTDADTGLQYLRARYYDPATAQFLSSDPLNAVLGPDPLSGSVGPPYAFVNDNPLNMTDPSGLCGISSLGDLGDCVNPTSEGNLAYQGAHAVYEYGNSHTFGFCVNASAGAGVGGSAQLCLAGNLHSVGGGASVAGSLHAGWGASLGGGPFVSNASEICELGGRFQTAGASISPGVGPALGANYSWGTSETGKTVEVFHPWVGAGIGSPASAEYGESETWTTGFTW